MPKTIYKKTYHRFFQRMWSGQKTCEIRQNMERVNVGDELVLIETSEKTGKETGRRLIGKITDVVTPREFYELFKVERDITVMSISINGRYDV